jgi:hypothetical protein
MTTTIKTVKFLKKGLRDASGEYHPVYYSLGQLVSTGKNAVTIYAKGYKALPAVLMAENNTDTMTDYFEKDRVRFNEGTPEFEQLRPFCQ